MNWLVTLPCTRAEAEALHEDDEWLALLEPMPTVVAEEVEAFNDLAWQVKAYFAEEPRPTVDRRDTGEGCRARPGLCPLPRNCPTKTGWS